MQLQALFETKALLAGKLEMIEIKQPDVIMKSLNIANSPFCPSFPSLPVKNLIKYFKIY